MGFRKCLKGKRRLVGSRFALETKTCYESQPEYALLEGDASVLGVATGKLRQQLVLDGVEVLEHQPVAEGGADGSSAKRSKRASA